MLEPLLYDRTGAVNKTRHVLRTRWLKHEFAGAVVHDIRGAGAEPSCPGPPIPCKDSIVEADEQFAIPPEGRIVCASQDEAHGVAVAADECCVFLSGLRGAVPRQNPVDLLERDRYPLHRGGGGDRLRLEVAPEAASPRSGDRTAVVELGSPAVQFADEVDDGLGVVWEQHKSILP